MQKINRKSPFSKIKDVFFLILRICTLLLFLVIIYLLVTYLIFNRLRLINEQVAISGTGSMYPTFPKGQNKNPKEQAKEIAGIVGMLPYPNGLFIFGKNYFGHQIEKGDIVTFSNKKTEQITKENYGEASGLIKRVIATEGDVIELKDGVVYLNGKPQKEPYTALPHSTFGGKFLSDCQKLKVPKGKVFVMGDNRKVSGDSRQEIGLVDLKDIDYVLPYKNQLNKLDKNWRDTKNDLGESSKIKINKDEYLKLLNQKRIEANLQTLRYENKLELSAEKRGQNILNYNDFSFEATKSGYTQLRAMNDVGYSNIVWSEAQLIGYYSADELIANLFEQPNWKKFLLSKDAQDFGLAEVEGQLNGCPTQIIVQHFAGYVPPNYKKENIDSWKKVLNSLKEIQPDWQKLKDSGKFYEQNKADIDKINELIALRILRTEEIVKQMEANQWLTQDQEQYLKDDENLYNQIDSLAKKLNKK